MSFLRPRLEGARSYDRIAGYFSSSILEVAGEAFDRVQGMVRIVCNSQMSRADVEIASAARAAMRREWCESRPETFGDAARPRFRRLYDGLRSGKLAVRVLPDDAFGLIHGKAGVITLADRQTCFIGSANESASAFRLNYELIWEDDAPEAVEWVQQEFDALWSSPFAVDLAEFVVSDLDRLARREAILDVDRWRQNPAPAAVFIEAPVYRREAGLWEHQKHFVKLAFDAHQGPHGARFVLADQVGLGKTLQLAMAAQLMALVGDRPVLVLAPKSLVGQWQGELDTLLGLPSAVWDGRQWVDERGVEHPGAGPESIRRCPRRIGIVSTGLITRGSEAADLLAHMRFECVILDEAHRARRRSRGADAAFKPADPNNLLRFLWGISPRTKSLLLATATPVQLHPIEAYDLLDALARGSDAVLGGPGSRWRNARASLDLVLGNVSLPTGFDERWDWWRNPLPPRSEGRDFQVLRNSLRLSDDAAYALGSAIDDLRPSDRQRIVQEFDGLVERHNPYIRTIVLRTREYLETTIDPETGEPYLTPVMVRLHGESDADAIQFPPFLEEAYGAAEAFCELLANRASTGFFRTLLLRRMGSTMEAGRRTVQRILDNWRGFDASEEDDEDLEDSLPALSDEERDTLQRLLRALEANREQDPKYAVLRRMLVDEGWLQLGCVVFSQYFDSVWWVANRLTVELPEESIGVYAGANRSGILHGGVFERCQRDALKDAVRSGGVRLLLGTDAASEGLNLQRLGSLINLDLPWNPSRLEQRKGRIQRIGQTRSEVDIYNMRYANSVEDRVRQLLSQRLKRISRLFGQLPDTLEDVWVQVALGRVEQARQTIDAVPEQHPFALRYHEVRRVDWESCARVLDDDAKRRSLARGWTEPANAVGQNDDPLPE